MNPQDQMSNIPSVPASPTGVAGIPPMVETPSNLPETPMSPNGIEGEQLSQEEMKTNLQDLMSKIQAKKQLVDTSMFDVAKSGKENKSMLFNEVYAFFQKNGVDPSDPEQVKAFLEKLKQTNPEIYQQIEKILNDITGGGELSAPTEVPQTEQVNGGTVPPTNMNMNPNETLPTNI